MVEFPTVSGDTRDIRYFADDLGLGKHSGSEIKCGLYSTAISTPASGSIVCKMYQGDKARRIPATIHLTNLGPVTNATTNFFTVAGIVNPAYTAGEDDRIIP